MKCNLLPFFLLFVVGRGAGGGGDFRSGSGSKFNCAARVGSDDLGYGPGSGFSFEPVQNSSSESFIVHPADITSADDTTVVCLFTNNDESTYMKEL